jgi:hypothetical protein
MKQRACLRLALALACFTIVSAPARLGETEAESERRYGAPLPQNQDPLTFSPLLAGAVNHTYTFQGWHIRAAFVEDKAVLIKYSKIPAKDVKLDIQDEELQAILAGEASGYQWRKATAPDGPLQKLALAALAINKEFVNTNGNRAHLEQPYYHLIIESPAAKAFLQARAAAKEQQRKATVPKF